MRLCIGVAILAIGMLGDCVMGDMLKRHFCTTSQCVCSLSRITCERLPTRMYDLESYEMGLVDMTLDLKDCVNMLAIMVYRDMLDKIFSVVLLPDVFMKTESSPAVTRSKTVQTTPLPTHITKNPHINPTYTTRRRLYKTTNSQPSSITSTRRGLRITSPTTPVPRRYTGNDFTELFNNLVGFTLCVCHSLWGASVLAKKIRSLAGESYRDSARCP